MDSHSCKERKMRRLWKSFSEDSGPVLGGGLSPDTEESKDETLEKKRFGSVLPALRLQLAEQGDPGAQLELARELLVTASLARREEGDEEAGGCEEAAVFWLIRAAEQGEAEAMTTLQVRSSGDVIDFVTTLSIGNGRGGQGGD